MQITRNEKQFEPISITLESQVEVDALVDVLCLISTNTEGSNEGTEFILQLSRKLYEYSNKYELVYYHGPHNTAALVKAK